MQLRTRVNRLKASRKRPPKVEIPDDPVEFVEQCLSMTPYPYQERLLYSVLANDAAGTKTIMKTGRRQGKTVCCSWLAYYFALSNPGSKTIIISPTQAQSSIMMNEVLTLWRQTKIIRGRATALTLRLDNTSSVVAMPGGQPQNLRGFGCDLLLCDEAAQMSSDLFAACLSFLAASPCPRLVLISTPFWARGDYYNIWERGEGWTRIEALPAECKHLSTDYIEEMRLRLSPSVFAADYKNSWLTGQAGLIPRDLIMSAMSENTENLDGLLDEALFDSGLADEVEDSSPSKKEWGDSWTSIGKTAKERPRRNEEDKTALEEELDEIFEELEE